jgi:MFS family permease
LQDLPPAPSGAIRWLSVYGFLLGLAGAVTFLVPLFVEEALGLSTRVAGLAAGLIGFTAIFGRIGWARFAERRGSFTGPLAAIAGIGVIGWLAFLGAAHLATWLLWVGVVLTGLGNSSWNSVGMLAVMSESGAARAGRASGVVMLGFLTGLGLGPPIYGWTVDQTGAYDAMWLLASALSVVGFIMASWRAQRTSVSGVARPPRTI